MLAVLVCPGLFFTQLTRDSGKAKLTMKRSMAIELLLYSSHWCSAWVSGAAQGWEGQHGGGWGSAEVGGAVHTT